MASLLTARGQQILSCWLPFTFPSDADLFTFLTSPLVLSLGLTDSATIGPRCSSVRVTPASGPFALAVLCLKSSFPGYQQGLLHSPSGRYSNATFSVMPSVLSKTVALFYLYNGRNFSLVHHCPVPGTIST